MENHKTRASPGCCVVVPPPEPRMRCARTRASSPPSGSGKRRRAAASTRRAACLSSAFAIGLMLLSQQFHVEVEAQSPAPSDAPSLIPTRTAASASGEPTPAPGVPDTGDPTAPPDAATPEPTPRPSGAMTPAPVFVPSPAPSAADDPPTEQPNPAPTPTPAPTTPRPSGRPTRRPSTRRPTPEPTTFSPTAEPTASPEPTTATKQPTKSPRPTARPTTTKPTPAGAETQVPSQESTLQKVSDVVSLKMTMEVMSGLMRNRSVLIYEQETTNFIKSSILTQDFGDAGLTYLFVDTIVATQKLVAPAPAPSAASASRKLQQQQQQQPTSSSSAADALEVLMDVQVDYRSTITDYSAAIWVGDAFNSASKRASYIAKLVATKDPTFAGLESLTSILVDGAPPVENPDTPSPDDSSGATVGIIVGSVVGGILLVALAVVGVKRMGGRDKGGAASQGHYPTTATTGSPPVFDSDPKFTTEIVVERQDDISTIGDPFVYGGMMMTEEQRDERTASVGDNYDYANQLLKANSTSAARGQSMMTGGIAPAAAATAAQHRSVGPVGASVLSDDDSFEQQFAEDDDEVDPAMEDRFEVEAPPGKLGMVIDTPNGEVPVVHALKSESVLANQVEVGDHLLSVDGEDVTGMTALEVSKLISLKSDQLRVLVFGRRAGSKRKDP